MKHKVTVYNQQGAFINFFDDFINIRKSNELKKDL
jgi:hypothetical protein